MKRVLFLEICEERWNWNGRAIEPEKLDRHPCGIGNAVSPVTIFSNSVYRLIPAAPTPAAEAGADSAGRGAAGPEAAGDDGGAAFGSDFLISMLPLKRAPSSMLMREVVISPTSLASLRRSTLSVVSTLP